MAILNKPIYTVNTAGNTLVPNNSTGLMGAQRGYITSSNTMQAPYPTAYTRTAEAIPFDRFRRYMKCNSIEELLNSYSAMAQLKGTTTEIEFNIAYGNWRGEQE
jgi:hypothetical protein